MWKRVDTYAHTLRDFPPKDKTASNLKLKVKIKILSHQNDSFVLLCMGIYNVLLEMLPTTQNIRLYINSSMYRSSFGQASQCSELEEDGTVVYLSSVKNIAYMSPTAVNCQKISYRFQGPTTYTYKRRTVHPLDMLACTVEDGTVLYMSMWERVTLPMLTCKYIDTNNSCHMKSRGTLS